MSSKSECQVSWPTRRVEVLERDDYTCQSCGESVGRNTDRFANVHHINPKSEGGSDKKSNLITLCGICHSKEHPETGMRTKSMWREPVMEEVIDALEEHGCATTGYISASTGHTSPVVKRRLDKLLFGGYIEYIHEPTAFWKLTNDPREEGEQ